MSRHSDESRPMSVVDVRRAKAALSSDTHHLRLAATDTVKATSQTIADAIDAGLV